MSAYKDDCRDLLRASIGLVWYSTLLCGLLYVLFFVTSALFA